MLFRSYMGTPTLVVEIISPSTKSKDMVDKLNTYMLSGVREYWIVDPNKSTIMLYGFKDRKIDEFHDFRVPDLLKSYFFKGLETDLATIFI